MESNRSWFYRVIRQREIGIIISLFILLLVFSVINPAMLLPDNLRAVLRASAFTGILSVGTTWILISGSFDLSIGSVAGLASVVTSFLAVKQGVAVIPAVVMGLLAGMSIGLLNYCLIFKAKIPAFLATIGTMYIAKGLAQYISKGFQIYPLPESVGVFGTATPLGVSWHFLIFVFLVIISQVILFRTVYGLEVRATGSDRETARNTEVNIRKVSISTSIIVGVLSALSGILLMSRLVTGYAEIGASWGLTSIAACAIGGVSLFGYEGSFFGMLLGVITLQVIQNGLVVIGLSPYLNVIIVGVILVITAAIDWQRRTRLDL